MRAVRRSSRPVVAESAQQHHGVVLLRQLGAKVYVIGTRRGRGEKDHGTHQTPGLPDVFAMVPRRSGAGHVYEGLWWEVKREGGRVRPEQREFQGYCLDSNIAHVVGPLDVLIQFLIERGYLSASSVPHYRLKKETV